MLCFDRIDVSEGIDINKTSKSKECDIYHYWYFLNEGFNFQSYICNRCHDVVMMSISLSDIPILNIKGTDYCCIIRRISKCEAINIIQKIDQTNKSIKHKTYYHI